MPFHSHAHPKIVNFKNLIFVFLLLLSFGCQREESTTVLSPDDVGLILWGEDSDKSGVRDDVEEWLNQSTYESGEKMALHYLAKNYQALLSVANEPFEANRRMLEVVRALDCLTLTMGGEKAKNARETLKRVQFNSPERIAAYRSAQQHLPTDKIKDLETYKDKDAICPFETQI